MVGLGLSMHFAAAGLPPPCDSGTTDVVVRDSTSLAELIERCNCSNGYFSVSWRDAHTLEQPIVVGNSTVLAIEGMGAGAILEGGGITRIIEVRWLTFLSLAGRPGAIESQKYVFDVWTEAESAHTATCQVHISRCKSAPVSCQGDNTRKQCIPLRNSPPRLNPNLPQDSHRPFA